MLKAKCPNCGHRGPFGEGAKWWKFNPPWPCKKCGVLLKEDIKRRFLVALIFGACFFLFEFWVKHWNVLVYCLLPVGGFIIFCFKRVKIVQLSNENSDVDRPQKAPFNEERR